MRALVTGASAGIGRALALELARQGADVALLARREERLLALADEVRARGRRAVVLPCDVRDERATAHAVERAAAEFGALDVVVANAGFGVTGRVEDLTVEDFRRQLETNVFGVLHTVKAAIPSLLASRGRLALVGSVSGHVSFGGTAPYAMSKFAVRALADALYDELRPRGVSVTHLAPGFVESEIRLLDAQGRMPPGARDPVPRWLVMPAEACARKMLRAVRRRRRERVVTAHGALAVWAHRLLPGLVRRAGRRAQRRRVASAPRES
jgi:short-subunit dehydrogenase